MSDSLNISSPEDEKHKTLNGEFFSLFYILFFHIWDVCVCIYIYVYIYIYICVCVCVCACMWYSLHFHVLSILKILQIKKHFQHYILIKMIILCIYIYIYIYISIWAIGHFKFWELKTRKDSLSYVLSFQKLNFCKLYSNTIKRFWWKSFVFSLL